MFRNRVEAGRALGEELKRRFEGEDVVVLGLPRGGVPVGYEVARALGAPLDVIVVRKLGVPFQSELAMGAIGEGGVRILNDEVISMAGVDQAELAAVERAERAVLERRAEEFRRGRESVSLAGRTALIVDDGIATGSTARAACLVARAQGAKRIVLAVPVAARSSVQSLADVADEVVCLEMPRLFFAVGQFYADFAATSDAEVVSLLEKAPGERTPHAAVIAEGDDPPIRDEDVEVKAGPFVLAGHLTVPEMSSGIVVFVHGSGSSRHSPRNRSVAASLNDAGLATLLFDLLTPDEEHDRTLVFDIELLACRLEAVTDWLGGQPEVAAMPVGYFGASTGAGAALWAAGHSGATVRAVVSRGGRPDLAAPRLASVQAPTLLIVGGHDSLVLELNHEAQQQLRCENRLVVVPGATHLFEEPGTLAEVARLAADWFSRYLR
jgi:putative phosphoribosyl transferase